MAQTGPVRTVGSQLARADGRKPRRCARKPSDEVRKVYSLAGWAMDGAGRAALLAQPGRVGRGFGPVEAVMAPSLPLVQNALRRW